MLDCYKKPGAGWGSGWMWSGRSRGLLPCWRGGLCLSTRDRGSRETERSVADRMDFAFLAMRTHDPPD